MVDCAIESERNVGKQLIPVWSLIVFLSHLHTQMLAHPACVCVLLTCVLLACSARVRVSLKRRVSLCVCVRMSECDWQMCAMIPHLFMCVRSARARVVFASGMLTCVLCVVYVCVCVSRAQIQVKWRNIQFSVAATVALWSLATYESLPQKRDSQVLENYAAR